jgi:hypothetical protein
MKKRILTSAAVLCSALAAASQAKDVHSPDGQWAVRAEKAISLVDSGGQEILTLVRDTTGDVKVEVAWSPDSRHVVVVENAARGSGIVAAWRDDAWHKTLQLDSQEGAFIDREQSRFHGRLVAEHRNLHGWVTPSAVLVEGDLAFSSGAKSRYGYTLEFRQVPGRLDRGGYEEGQLIGRDYHDL